MSIELIAIDLDGTLLTSGNVISPGAMEVIRVARETAKVHVVLASARPPRSMLPYYLRLNLEAPLVSYNGALVYDPRNHRVLLHRAIPLGTAREVITRAREYMPGVVVSGEFLNRWYTDHVDTSLMAGAPTVSGSEPDGIGPIDQWLTKDVTKILLGCPAEQLRDLARAIGSALPHQVTILQMEACWLQIMHPTANKLAGLQAVAAEMGIARKNIMAIGDQVNDIEMLQWAGLGVAMSNAPDEVLAVADKVTDDNDADGVAKAIQSFVLLPHRKKSRGFPFLSR